DPVGDSRLVDRRDVGVSDARESLTLAAEALEVDLAAARRALEHLERDPALELLVVGRVDRAHRALSEELRDPVVPDLFLHPHGKDTRPLLALARGTGVEEARDSLVAEELEGPGVAREVARRLGVGAGLVELPLVGAREGEEGVGGRPRRDDGELGSISELFRPGEHDLGGRLGIAPAPRELGPERRGERDAPEERLGLVEAAETEESLGAETREEAGVDALGGRDELGDEAVEPREDVEPRRVRGRRVEGGVAETP